LRTPNTPHISGRSHRIGSAATARLLKPAGSRHPWPDEIATHWGQGSKTPLIKVQPQLVVEVAADAALQHGQYRHPLRLIRLRAESKTRSHVPRVRVYPDHVFMVVHAPEIGAAGHVHYLELDQFIGHGEPRGSQTS
jgi:hypothetical protein